MIGKTLGNRYTILEEINGGGMAFVYKAKCTLLNRIVAVKILKPEFSKDEDFIRRFRREAQAAASLSHPNIVGIYDVGDEDGFYYIVMEYVEGKTLKELIKEQSPMPPSQVIDIGIQICDALECAHRNRIVHRDIKSQNIMITPDGRVKVTDFGIARAASSSTITNTGNVFGSVHYFSPEQASGDEADERSDIYSVGVVLYEAFSGKLPFEGQTPVAVALKQIQQQPDPILKAVPGFPEALELIVKKCLDKSPDARYQSSSELRKELEKAADEPSVLNYHQMDMGHTLVLNNIHNEQLRSNSRQNKKPRSKVLRNIGIAAIAVLLFAVFSYLGGAAARKYFEVPEVAVPDVVGLSEEEAAKKLSEKNLKYQIVDSIYDDVPSGQIIDQDPKGGETVKVNHPPISLVVSKGPKRDTVPGVIGFTEQDAVSMITNDGFRANIIRDYSDDVPEGIVIDQNPREGLQLDEGDVIDITVSMGVKDKQLNVPILIGKTLKEAEAMLEDQKIPIAKVTKKPSDVPENVVIDQSPKPGETLTDGSAVQLVISSGPIQTKSKNLTIPLPPEPEKFLIKIIVTDDLGKREVYSETHTPDDSPLKVKIEGAGTMNVEVWCDDERLHKRDY
jgi:serine/threonine protein kinase